QAWSWTPGWLFIAGFYAVLARLAWRRPGLPILPFFFWLLLLVPLPIELLEGRREACFALLMVAATAFGSVILVDGAHSAARFLVREFKLPVRAGVLAAVIVAGGLLLWVREQNDLRRAI